MDRRFSRGIARPAGTRWYGRLRDHRPMRPASGCSAWFCRLNDRLFMVRNGFDLQIEQRRAQRFAMRVKRKRPRHPTGQRAGHDKIQRRYVGQLIADNLAFDNTGKMRLDPCARDLLEQQRIEFRVIGNHGNVGGVALVTGAGMGDFAQLHRSSPPTKWTCGVASSRGSRTEATATTSRADLKAPPPAAGPLV